MAQKWLNVRVVDSGTMKHALSNLMTATSGMAHHVAMMGHTTSPLLHQPLSSPTSLLSFCLSCIILVLLCGMSCVLLFMKLINKI